MTGLAFLILALLALAAASYPLIVAHNRALGILDRRLSKRASSAAAAVIRQERPVAIPKMAAPLFARAQIEPGVRTVGSAIAGLLALSVLALIAGGSFATLAVALGLPALAAAYLVRRARKRIDALIEALPYYIDSVRQMQMVGSSLPQALERALTDAPEAVRNYMAPVARRLELGAPVAETMQQLSNRLNVPEVAMLAAAISTNLRYGGPVSTVLANLANILRTRVRIKRELEAATSQAKVSGRILIVMPVLAMALLMAVSPGYVDFFLHDPRGHVLAIVALCLQVMGVLVMNRMMRLVF